MASGAELDFKLAAIRKREVFAGEIPAAVRNGRVIELCLFGAAGLRAAYTRQVGAGIFGEIVLKDSFRFWGTAFHEGAVVFPETLACQLPG